MTDKWIKKSDMCLVWGMRSVYKCVCVCVCIWGQDAIRAVCMSWNVVPDSAFTDFLCNDCVNAPLARNPEPLWWAHLADDADTMEGPLVIIGQWEWYTMGGDIARASWPYKRRRSHNKKRTETENDTVTDRQNNKNNNAKARHQSPQSNNSHTTTDIGYLKHVSTHWCRNKLGMIIVLGKEMR